MRVLNTTEVGVVSGGADEVVCEAPSAADQYDGIGWQITQEVGGFFAGLNQLGSDLGAWAYNYIHGC